MLKLGKGKLATLCVAVLTMACSIAEHPKGSSSGTTASQNNAPTSPAAVTPLEALRHANVPLPPDVLPEVDPAKAQAAAAAARALPGSRAPFESLQLDANIALLPVSSTKPSASFYLTPASSDPTPSPTTSPTASPSASPSPTTVATTTPAATASPTPSSCPKACATACATAVASAHAEAFAHASAVACAFATAWACAYSFDPFAQVCAWGQGSACASAFASAFGEGFATDTETSCNTVCS